MKSRLSSGEEFLELPHGQLRLPIFTPDATFGVVRSVDSLDVEQCGIEAVVMNTFHLMQRPGSSTVRALGGLHRMAGWDKPIITDSGGFQAYSLIRQNPKYGQMTDRGIIFKPEGAVRKYQLTPEKTVQLQLSYGSDVVICLDDCTHPDDSFEVQQESVKRTIDWVRRCKLEFVHILNQRGLTEEDRPLLFAVIQGGRSQELRKRCAEALLEIGFDGYGYGGWPLDSEGKLLIDIIAYTRELVPSSFPLHALGIGHPQNIVECNRYGYDIFDSSLPTRDARQGRLYSFASKKEQALEQLRGDWFSYVYVNDKKHIKTDSPVYEGCDCLSCSKYSLGYLHHLFKMNDALFLRLATIHNLRFMATLIERLRTYSNDKTLSELKSVGDIVNQ
ncbi:MAG: queuine tRNA-ribosyltransferase family protein [Acidobacteria bacterium]|nr:queuine tRNA-ribosyltransferase family protein [Acidobacteriota bacterium]